MQPGTGGLEAELLLHAGWMRQLAAHLVDDASLADDAAQEAALSALARPPRAVRRPRAYLAEVVRNAARRLGRAEGRRARREVRAARPEAVPSAAELAAEAELQRELAASLLALEEPYRSTLVLRFYRDLEPTAIARLTGVPAGTVRSRLSRGLELLRARLDARCGGREAWSALLAPLATWTTAGRSGLAATAGIAGGIAMGIKAALACAGALAVAGVLYVVLRGSHERLPGELASAEEAAPARSEAAPAPAAAEGQTSELEPAVGEAERVALAAAPAVAKSTIVRLVAHEVSEQRPAAGVLVAMSPFGQDGPILASAATDANGRAVLEATGQDLTQARLAWSAPALRSRSRDFDDLSGEVELRVVWLGSLTGIVSDAETGEPLEEVDLQISHDARGLDEEAWAIRTGPGGRFAFNEVSVERYSRLFARREGYLDQAESFHLGEPGEAAVLNMELEHGFELALRVYDAVTGAPLQDASISHTPWSQTFARTDAEGLVKVRAGVGHELALCVEAADYCMLRWNWVVAAIPSEASARIPMLRAAWIEGRVTEGDGKPVPNVRLSTECAECLTRGHGVEISEAEQRGLGLHGSCLYVTRLGPETDEEGRYRLPALPCGHASTLNARHTDFVAHQVLLDAPLPPGGEARIDVQLTHGGVIRGRVLKNGAPRSGMNVAWRNAEGAQGGAAIVGGDGAYELLVAPGEVTLALERGGEPLEERRVKIEPGQVLQQDFISVSTRSMTEIRGRVVASGAAVPEADITAYGISGGEFGAYTTRTDADGVYRLPVPDDGVFEVSAERGPARRSIPGVAAGASGVDFDLPLTGTLRLRLLDARTGEPARAGLSQDNMVCWRPAGQKSYQSDRANPDLHGLQDLQVEAGSVDVLVFLLAEGYAPCRAQGILVPVDGTSEVFELALQPGLQAGLRFQGDGVQPKDLGAYLLFLVEESELDGIAGPFTEQDGTLTYLNKGMWLRLRTPTTSRELVVDGDGAVLVQGLAPGRYHLRVFPDDFIFEPATFDLPSPTAEPVAVRWRRR